MAGSRLERLLVLHEPEAACQGRLVACGMVPEVAGEVAFYLAQATDFAAMLDEVGAALATVGVELVWAALDEHERWLPLLLGPWRAGTLLWSLTDGFLWYRGSFATALAALLDVPQLGSPPSVQHLCQDKFRSGAIAQAAGLRVPPTLLAENGVALSPLTVLPPEGSYFVKPNTLGAKLGITADSRAATWAEALALTRRLWSRYGDRAVVQAYVPGRDVRVSCLDLGRAEPVPLGIDVIATSTGTGFATLADSQRMTKLAAAGTMAELSVTIEDLTGTPAAAAIAAEARSLARLLPLRDYWSMDFRLDALGQPWFLEFEVCPAVTIYDFRSHLRRTYGLDLPAALAEAVPLAYARRLAASLP